MRIGVNGFGSRESPDDAEQMLYMGYSRRMQSARRFRGTMFAILHNFSS